MKETIEASGLMFWFTIVLVICIAVGTLVYLSFEKHIINLHRENIQHSNEYEQSKVTELVDTYERYQNMETQKQIYANNQSIVDSYSSQQLAAVHRMCNAYQLLPADIRTDVVPAYIVSFLNEKGCY